MRHKLALLVFTFGLGFLLPQSLAAPLQASVANYDSLDTSDATVEFHSQMNEITNEYIQLLFESEEADIHYPGDEDLCTTGNVSTFCLAVELNEELTAFEQSMTNRRDSVEFNLEEGEVLDLPTALEQASTRRVSTEDEVRVARATLELTLSVYSQLQTVYPVDAEFDKLLDNLEEYNDNLAELRRVLERYPSKFHDATTLQCT